MLYCLQQHGEHDRARPAPTPVRTTTVQNPTAPLLRSVGGISVPFACGGVNATPFCDRSCKARFKKETAVRPPSCDRWRAAFAPCISCGSAESTVPDEAGIGRETAREFVSQAKFELTVRQAGADAAVRIRFAVAVQFELRLQNEALRKV